ncbi:hypothetical protein KIK06_02780 [Nocardiopsis sp. EMB25]|uniref:hypothetical protein n=1 Tax=Nocardiopsis sp. EMB25 TaxID=2835867 RepID=UPI002283DB72|nr:hypothetical protein [Nocardiopsis sp. EMB25]MCY9782812.1 hypothetical protein [Nocardiopsis sp. EMB25]
MSTIVVRPELTPTPEQAAVPASTPHAPNDHANRVSGMAHAEDVYHNHPLRELAYRGLRQAGVGSQAAQHTVKKAAEERAVRLLARGGPDTGRAQAGRVRSAVPGRGVVPAGHRHRA